MKTTSMQAIVSALNRVRQPAASPLQTPWPSPLKILLVYLLSSLFTACQPSQPPATRVLNIQQEWELEPGEKIANHLVTGSLGDVSIELQGSSVYAPFDGEVAPATQSHCVIYSTPDVPAYLFRLCGLHQPRLGTLTAGQRMGSGDYLQFATMRRQPDGTWIIVEPSTGILERTLDPQRQTAKTP
jgi:hypothetical protein